MKYIPFPKFRIFQPEIFNISFLSYQHIVETTIVNLKSWTNEYQKHIYIRCLLKGILAGVSWRINHSTNCQQNRQLKKCAVFTREKGHLIRNDTTIFLIKSNALLFVTTRYDLTYRIRFVAPPLTLVPWGPCLPLSNASSIGAVNKKKDRGRVFPMFTACLSGSSDFKHQVVCLQLSHKNMY